MDAAVITYSDLTAAERAARMASDMEPLEERECAMFSKEQVFGLLRTLLAFGAGVLVTNGLIDQGTVDAVIAAIITLGTAGWSLIEKAKT